MAARGAEGVALGLDFGTESVRALWVDLAGRELGAAEVRYRHGQIVQSLPTSGAPLPADYALQHPNDWLEAAETAARQARRRSPFAPEQVVGIGVDFTSCTMLPTLRDGTPLCLLESWARVPLAWPKLWKHHGAKWAAEQLLAAARRQGEPWLARYGGLIGLEWFFPKMLETITEAPEVAEAAEVWLEAGDWFVWQLIGGEAEELPRSTCQAGYKALWSAEEGYPSQAFLEEVDPRLARAAAEKLPGRFCAPGVRAGGLCDAWARRLELPAGTPVSAAVIDAHAGVPGAGAAEEGVLVMVLGTSSCHMLNAREERLVPGIAGVVQDGILPGYYGYETGQAAVGDLFDWLRRLVGAPSFAPLDRQAALLPPGAEGVTCLDWMNGCRTPLMDGRLTGAFTGLTLAHGPEHLYRAAIEGTACGLRWIVELLREHGLPVSRLVATGGLPQHNPLLVQIYADLLGEPIEIPRASQGPALGAAILGALAAGGEATGFPSTAAAIRAMTTSADGSHIGQTVRPHPEHHRAYDEVYARYRELTAR